MAKGLFEFVFEHTDSCPRCSSCDFCETGKQLMRAAADLGAALFVPNQNAAFLAPKAKA